MEKINSKNLEESKNENHLKLLGKKTIHFTVEKYPNYNKKPSTINLPEENLNEGRWSYIEQIKFIKALSKDGPNWKKIGETINFRTLSQIRSHAQKFFLRLKRCKNNELGIDFTSNSIKSFKDMINHIKLVNSNYDINNVFLYLSDINQQSLDELTKKTKEDELSRFIAAIVCCPHNELTSKKNDFNVQNKKIMTNTNSQSFEKDNNKFDSNNLNNILLLDNLNNMNNNLNVFILNYLNKSKKTNNLINKLYNIYLENINNVLANVTQSFFMNTNDSPNDSNINKIFKDMNKL